MAQSSASGPQPETNSLRSVQQVDSELAMAMKDLEKEREAAEKSINEQVEALSNEIVSRLLPDEPEPKATAPAS